MKKYAIEFKNVYFSYGKTEVLKEVTFALEQGDFLGIIGPNGGGKTTLLKLMLGLLRPDKGQILVLGEEPLKARHKVGYVPQSMDFNLGFPISAMEVVLMGRLGASRIGRRYSEEDKQKARRALERVGMWEYRHMPVGSLSGGQRQKVFIARALATEPKILFLDEPTASVDPDFQTDLYDFLKELNAEATIVVITHDIGVVSSYMKSIACVNKHLIFHEAGKITQEMLEMAYQCPVDLVAHGLPHRVLPTHGKK
ncbi:MAG: ABC transporter ATP-binding protein [Deltaproteobacteria bacterium]|nr:ABC transporter ATP-binding protein [Deltaproteobacteria bacterium]MBW1919396.1 ABC transporter ATP-binding protein [Deltaproteobacteria bacterium]MBW1934481.1 ABC transporter ATP-binding protein [Deltaproteobacteria bacterium]MBW1979141.1 ABC transporter ATP-binding protein [Deltaproteobacteria bacterium]MBW2045968.1 ABC transporter ATP-binding protein [Deltaproteobacteria bacterium]